MAAAVINPYLAFSGKCKEAMEFYHSVLGGELKMTTMGEGAADHTPDDEKHLIMHAQLDNGPLTFMASDGTKDHPVTMGDNISMSISGEDDEVLTKYYNGLSAGGQIIMPLEKAPWGDKFAMFTDKFGVKWMVNISAGQPAEAQK